MKQLFRQAAPLTVLAAALLSGCSGGTRGAGIEGTGDLVAAKGTVTAFGSIWVNGVRFDTDSAAVIVDGEAASEEAIMPGMVVMVEGAEDANGQAYAQRVTADALINGPITAVTSTGLPYAQISVVGQTVIVPEEAVFAGLDRQDLAVGMQVRVSGLSQNDGSTLATRIEQLHEVQEVDVEGAISSLDSDQYLLTLGDLQVRYANAELSGNGQSSLSVGQNVEIHGTLLGDSPAVLNATSIRFKEPAPEQVPGSRMVWEGMIESFESPAAFKLNDLGVDASTAQIERGSINQLGNGVRVAVSGRLNQHGVVIADSVKLLLPSETRFSATVEAADNGQMTVLNTTFASDSFTAFEDLSPMGNRRMNFSDISSGDTVEVFGRNINGSWVATRIRKVSNDSGESSFRGPVGSIVSAAEIYVMGVLVDASNAEGAELIEQLAPGDFVTVEGVQTGPQTLMASSIELAVSDDCPAPVAAACGPRPGKPTPGQDKGNNGNADERE